MALATPALDFKAKGFEVLEQIRRDYFLPKTRLYAEKIDKNGRKSGPCFNWSTGVLLSALNAGAKLNKKYRAWLREYANSSRIYWNEKGPVPGYDVLPTPKPADRYYDDNAWMVLALIETFEVLGDKKYLDWADQTLNYVLSGWDEKLGGGIYWRESEKTSKNTCINAPAAVACLAMSKYRRSAELVRQAEKLLEWTEKNLQDPADGLLWDNISLEGKVEKTKWTYNTGLYMRGWGMLAQRVEIDQFDLDRVFQSSIKRWFDPTSGAARDGGRFAHLWFEGLMSVESKDRIAKPQIRKALEYVYSHVRNSAGRYAGSWDKPITSNRAEFELIDQASVARAFLMAAQN